VFQACNPRLAPENVTCPSSPLSPASCSAMRSFYPASLHSTAMKSGRPRSSFQTSPTISGGLQVILNGTTYDQPANTSITWMEINLGAGKTK